MSSLGRRKFLITTGAAGLAAAFATLAQTRRAQARGRWGELIPDPDGVLDLPEGFSYQILEDAGQTMSDGYQLPGRPDGMACFAGPDNTLILMRNHENSVGDFANGPYQDGQDIPPEAYEPDGNGGVTRLVVDATTYERISSNLVLIGTARNCAGGPSPWGWLSCEENVGINDVDGQQYRHGYTFLCPTDAETVQPPQPIVGYGRCNHEAVAIDPATNIAYLSEDRVDSCLYRFVPDDPNDPFTGQLQALKVVGEDGFSTLTMATGDSVDVEWVDIDEPDPDDDTLRDEAQSKGAALIIRGEGIWFADGEVYLCATFGGLLGKGQIFRLVDGDSPTLEVLVASDDANILDNPDNITVAPWGEVFLVEDGDGDNYIRWVTADGQVCDFGRNAISDSEMAGICFSPDGKAMFVNIQVDGLTLVITGPFVDDGGGTDTGGADTGETGGGETTGGETAGEGGTDTGGTGGGDEVGDTGGTAGDGMGDAGLDDEGGCSCSTDEGSVGLSAAAGLAAAVGARVLVGGESEGEAKADDEG